MPDAEELTWRRSRGPDDQGGSADSELQDGRRHLAAGHDEQAGVEVLGVPDASVGNAFDLEGAGVGVKPRGASLDL